MKGGETDGESVDSSEEQCLRQSKWEKVDRRKKGSKRKKEDKIGSLAGTESKGGRD